MVFNRNITARASLKLMLFTLGLYGGGALATDARADMNRLANEKSPYLQQHKENPVDWYPWGEEAFKKAEAESKPIFLSIGYSTCYWCHVMEQDSFEKDEVAEVLNRHFVSIKVDREERPDVDQIYMDAVIGITGHGGWPMSVFLTSERKPFFAGTFFWKDQFIALLMGIQQQWTSNPKKLTSSAAEVTKWLKQRNPDPSQTDLDERPLRQAYRELSSLFDSHFGGFSPAPKFPPTGQVRLLLRLYRRSGDQQALKMVEHTLEQMARGGIFDHLAGGFARYSTDEKWLVPHFEKMLYDNALLTIAYLEAYQVTGKGLCRDVARMILDYVLATMTAPEGCFYSAEDAGEVGKEGEFYVFGASELKALLSESEYKAVKDVFGVSEGGNFEGNNILHLPPGVNWSRRDEVVVQAAREKLLSHRNARVRPHLDDKTLTSWNGLMISAMSRGGRVLKDARYIEAASTCANFLKSQLYVDGELKRRYRSGEARFDGYLDDYAFLIEGLINLYEAGFDVEWLRWAQVLQQKQGKLFWDQEGVGYFFSHPSDETLIVRRKDFVDGALPSGNGVSALNLLKLFSYTAERDYLTRARKLLSAILSGSERGASAYSSALMALDFELDQAKELVVIGDGSKSKIFEFLGETFLPNQVVAHSEEPKEARPYPPILMGKKRLDGKITYFVCENHVCTAPSTDLDETKRLLGAFEKLTLQ